jgi:2-iminobutanoate/2-iminopropanoate deaminase
MAQSVYVPGLDHGTNPIPAAARRGPLLATGRVSGVDRSTSALPTALAEEVRCAFTNLEDVVVAGGGTWEDVVHLTVYLAESATRAAVNNVWVKVFPDESARPARHVVVATLPGGFALQLEALAYVRKES